MKSAITKGSAPWKTCVSGMSRPDRADDEAVQPDRRRHKADARHLDDDDAEPDRIVAERDHGRIEHRQRQQHHADRVHEHAEDEIDEEDADNDHHAVDRQMRRPIAEKDSGRPAKPRKRTKIRMPQMIAKIITRELGGLEQRFVELASTSCRLQHRDDEDDEGAERAGFGRRRPAEEHRREDDHDDAMTGVFPAAS